jgi:hypothetical protein
LLGTLVTVVTTPLKALYHTPGFLYHAPRIFFKVGVPSEESVEKQVQVVGRNPVSTSPELKTDVSITRERNDSLRSPLDEAIDLVESMYSDLKGYRSTYERARTQLDNIYYTLRYDLPSNRCVMLNNMLLM